MTVCSKGSRQQLGSSRWDKSLRRRGKRCQSGWEWSAEHGRLGGGVTILTEGELEYIQIKTLRPPQAPEEQPRDDSSAGNYLSA